MLVLHDFGGFKMARKERGNPKFRAMMEEFGIKKMEDVHAQ